MLYGAASKRLDQCGLHKSGETQTVKDRRPTKFELVRIQHGQRSCSWLVTIQVSLHCLICSNKLPQDWCCFVRGHKLPQTAHAWRQATLCVYTSQAHTQYIFLHDTIQTRSLFGCTVAAAVPTRSHLSQSCEQPSSQASEVESAIPLIWGAANGSAARGMRWRHC